MILMGEERESDVGGGGERVMLVGEERESDVGGGGEKE